MRRDPKKKLISRDNYGAGFNASPLETHTYWLQICGSEEKSKRVHSHNL